MHEIEGRTLTVTRIEDGDDEPGWENEIFFRVYDPAVEEVPEFNGKTYTYHGLENEKAPKDVEEVIVDPSAKLIRDEAFIECEKMKKCTMGDNVEKIEVRAFENCHSIKNLRLSRSLRYIEENAFCHCSSIKCLFILPNVREIQGKHL